MNRGPKTKAGKVRWTCISGSHGKREYCYSTTNPQLPKRGRARMAKAVMFRRSKGGITKFIITSAQNATPRHDDFVKTLEVMANEVNAAEIFAVPIRYKNPTSKWEPSRENAEWWDLPDAYMCNQRKRLHKNLVLVGDLKVQATSSDPLRGLEAYTHSESGIFGHTKVQSRTVPVPAGRFPKIITTTGACTVQNYSDTRLGKLGEFHHTLGAIIVELDGPRFHIRRVNASKKTGEFIDLRKHYTTKGVKRSERYKAVVMGDTHRDFIDKGVEIATFGKGGIVEELQPEFLVWHDLDDNYAVNPHHKGPWSATAKRMHDRHRPKDELIRACEFVSANTPKGTKSVIVFSNHNEFLARWIADTDWRGLHDQKNNDFYLETARYMNGSLRLDGTGTHYDDPFNYWARRLLPENVAVVLDIDQEFMIGGIDCGQHGHLGPNGSRGSLRNLRRIGTKVIIGHGHGPGEDEGGMQVGTSTPRKAEYTHGPGGWMNTHGTINSLDKRTLLNIIDDTWRAR